jgi:glucose-6-phosphate 1-epimerase
MTPGWRAIPHTEVRSPDGARACISERGAHLLSWIPAGGQEALFMSATSLLDAGAAIRGGVPVIFPQFSTRGSGQRHGFARNSVWHCVFAGVEGQAAVARFTLDQRSAAVVAFEHEFALQYEVAIQANHLRLTLSVHNPSSQVWQFNAALHTYLQVADAGAIGIQGLQGLDFIDQVQGGVHYTQREQVLALHGEVDRIYAGLPGAVTVQDGARRIVVSQEGFADAVVWNPGAEKAAGISDLHRGGAQHYVCVEAAAVIQPIALAPGQTWSGWQIIRIE